MTIPGMDTENYEVIKEHKIAEDLKDLYAVNYDSIKRDDKVHTANSYQYLGFSNGYEGIIGSADVFDDLLDELVIYKDCSNVDSLPDITFTIDGQDYVLNGKDYVLNHSGECTLGIMVMTQYTTTIPRGMTVLGNIFLSKFYPYFNMNNDTVSFQREKTTELIQ